MMILVAVQTSIDQLIGQSCGDEVQMFLPEGLKEWNLKSEAKRSNSRLLDSS